MPIHFYKEKGTYGFLATYAPYGFYANGIYWKTSEHYYQAQKFLENDIRLKIASAETPKMASEIGRNRKYAIRENWDEIRADVMYEAVLLKFLANPDIAILLLATQNEMIIEDTEKENFWGCGPNKDGQNMYGKILCRVRDDLRKMQ